ncbi:MAG TPA: hypothetical protein VN843_03660 [Anaerolineales bacterium]|nr:hypothetical protein [Anaerolineales bacterium]
MKIEVDAERTITFGNGVRRYLQEQKNMICCYQATYPPIIKTRIRDKAENSSSQLRIEGLNSGFVLPYCHG